MYETLARRLDTEFHVYAIDFRGHGDSGVPDDGNFAWAAMVDDLLAIVDHLGLERVAAFGHSLGGSIVLLAELTRPGVIAAGFLYEPIVWPAGFRHAGPNPMAGPARRRREVFGSRAEAIERFAARPPLAYMRADALLAYAVHGMDDLEDGTVRLKCRGESEARTFEAEEVMTLDRLTGLHAPLRVAAGRRDLDRVGGLALGVADVLGSEPLLYDHLGHFGPFQDPETVAVDIARFLRR